MGTVNRFGEWSLDPHPLSALVAQRSGLGRAYLTFEPGAFDECLRRVRVGQHVVRFQFDHDTDLAVCSTDDALVLMADAHGFAFYVRGSTRKGANAVTMARAFSDRRQVSMSWVPTKFLSGTDGGRNVLIVQQAAVYEVSLVREAAFPKTSVEFL